MRRARYRGGSWRPCLAAPVAGNRLTRGPVRWRGNGSASTGSDTERRALIAFLKTLSVDPAPRATVLGQSTSCRRAVSGTNIQLAAAPRVNVRTRRLGVYRQIARNRGLLGLHADNARLGRREDAGTVSSRGEMTCGGRQGIEFGVRRFSKLVMAPRLLVVTA
jgi:hypothetical protein